MTHPAHHPNPSAETIRAIEGEIAALEAELGGLEARINAFETRVRVALQPQIARLKELTALYKRLKNEKKEKRREQKKKGKNYKEPQGLKKTGPAKKLSPADEREEEELKRLYKEAVVRIHPDKFVNGDPELSERATTMTAQLNFLYDAGDLQELSALHQHILSGNAMSHVPYKPQTLVDPNAMVTYLRKKRDEMVQALEALKASEWYGIINAHPEPTTFIDTLRPQFEERIQVLTKRTRKA
ncbi:hypothetical protein [Chryseolinea soli]|uniref:J domain-containing protein n=1 Tax=Chryseolinea soli TaxID=2321403 RepID=A0A385SIE6_9BACT|nr:hypothetical protein [Chryseolinea soli]AYB30067.1 hypothetical protein D4L85_05510 [Chryseolinea soli]